MFYQIFDWRQIDEQHKLSLDGAFCLIKSFYDNHSTDMWAWLRKAESSNYFFYWCSSTSWWGMRKKIQICTWESRLCAAKLCVIYRQIRLYSFCLIRTDVLLLFCLFLPFPQWQHAKADSPDLLSVSGHADEHPGKPAGHGGRLQGPTTQVRQRFITF